MGIFSKLKRKIARAAGVPTTSSGRARKVKSWLGWGWGKSKRPKKATSEPKKPSQSKQAKPSKETEGTDDVLDVQPAPAAFSFGRVALGILGVLMFLICLANLGGNRPAPTPATPAPEAPRPVAATILPERDRADEAASEAKIRDAAIAKREDERQARERLLEAERSKAAAEAKALEEQHEAEMVAFEESAIEYHADNMLRIARQLWTEAQDFRRQGNLKEWQRLQDLAENRYKNVQSQWPDTDAAADAELLLARKEPPSRPRPPYPILPYWVVKTEPHPTLGAYVPPKQPPAYPATGVYPLPVRPLVPINAVNVGRTRTVQVRSYTRKDGTVVRAHTRRVARR